MRKIFKTWVLACLGNQKTSKFQRELLEEILREGSFGQLVWFKEKLKYLSGNELNEKAKILVAFEG